LSSNLETRRKQRKLINSNQSHTAIMAKTEQIDATAHGILNVSARANTPQSGAPTQFRSRILFLAQRSLQTREGMFTQKESS
jgi:hypothetical protein